MDLRGGKKKGLRSIGQEDDLEQIGQGDMEEIQIHRERDIDIQGDEAKREISTDNNMAGNSKSEESEEKEDMLKMLVGMMQNMGKQMEETKNDMGKKMDENNRNMKKIEENMEKKMDENKNDIGKKMDENNKELKENSRNMEKIIEEIQELKQDREEIVRKIEDLRNYTEEKLEETKTSMRAEMIARITEVEDFQEIRMKKMIEEGCIEDLRKIEQLVEERSLINGKMLEEINNISQMKIPVIEEKIEDIKKKQEEEKVIWLKELENNGMNMKCVNVNEFKMEHKFNGDIRKIHPKVFMKILKYKLRNVICIEEIKEYIREALDYQVLVWFSSKESEIQSLEDFEKFFLKYYWGEIAQSKIRERLYFGKFDERRGTGYSNYALNLYNTAQYLDPGMKEEEIIMFVSRHFKHEIAETIALQNMKTMDTLSDYLLRMEQNLGAAVRNRFSEDWRGRQNNNGNTQYNELINAQNRGYNRNNYNDRNGINRNYRSYNNYNGGNGSNNREQRMERRYQQNKRSESEERGNNQHRNQENNTEQRNRRVNNVQVEEVRNRRNEEEGEEEVDEENFLRSTYQN